MIPAYPPGPLLRPSQIPVFPGTPSNSTTGSDVPGAANRQWRTMRVETVVLITVIYMVAAANAPWWTAVSSGRDPADPATWLFLSACFLALVALHFIIIAPLANRWTVKPLLTVILLLTGAASYFMRTYSVMLDPTMLQNIVHTDLQESRELLSWSLTRAVVAWTIAPVAFVWLTSIERRPWSASIAFRALCVVVALGLSVLSVLSVSRDLASQMREQRELRYLITPGNYLVGLASSAIDRLQADAGPRRRIGDDAHLAPAALPPAKPRVLVLVLGETARAANFSLLGYPRETNPELSRLALIAYRDVTACGTSTEVSVPCMFSPYGREHYDERRIRESEGLLDVLVHAGYDVRWRDNQSGCKGVCRGDGIDYRKLDATFAPEFCDAGMCFDEVLNKSLDAELASIDGNTVIVLHMLGNHGPAYYQRYPTQFRRYAPDCQTAQLRDCDQAQLVNAYDNAILYTDHVLAGLVASLRERSTAIDAAMLYVSDHGESLGEARMYLHGLPFAIAPDVQTHVPMIAWLSDELASSGNLERQCLQETAGLPLTHDNLFHTVLGLMAVGTAIYRPEQDFMQGCRAGPHLQVDVRS